MKHFICALCVLTFIPLSASANKVKYKKTQEVDFEGSSVDGKASRPEGVYLVQKRGIDFVPLYKVRENFDRNLKESVEYIK